MSTFFAGISATDMLYGSNCVVPNFHVTFLAEEHDEQFRVRFDDETASQTLASPVQ